MADSPTIHLFGDFTDPWYPSMIQIHEDAATTTWLRSFLDDCTSVVREETRGIDPQLMDSMGGANFISLLEVVEMYREKPEEHGLVQCVMAFIMRAVPLLRLAKANESLLTSSSKSLALGISGGLIVASTMAIAHDFESLYEACLIAMGSRAVEEVVGVWGCAVLGVDPDELNQTLIQFQQNMGIHEQRRCKVGVRGDRWGTVIGPPSVVKLCLTQCPSIQHLTMKELPIRSLQHNCPTTPADHEYIAGDSKLHALAVRPDFRLFGLDELPDGLVASVYPTWRHLLCAVADQTFSKTLDFVETIRTLDSSLKTSGANQAHIQLMGPSCHEPYILGFLGKCRQIGSIADRKGPNGAANNQTVVPVNRIAVVGISGRGPGSSTTNLDEFWAQILNGEDLAEAIPQDRFDAEILFTTTEQPGAVESRQDQQQFLDHQCKSTCRYGCFMRNPGHFDARFFHISPREALLMDPGSRLFQMAGYEALEMAGYSRGATEKLNPARIGVYYGQSNDDGYMTAHHERGCDAFTLQAAERAFPAGRMAFHYGWEGPTWAVDCACSTGCSMVHMACVSLRRGEVDMCVVGAANVMAFPHGWCGLSKSGVLSDTGNCKTFREDADGYCRGDFVGAVVLKRLEDALQHNDNVLAVVAGSGRNQSGNAPSITSSEQGAQERLFRQVLRDAVLSPSDVSYVEMHGTGTPVGDPVEMGAVASVFGRPNARAGEEPLTVGAVKANFGHSEAASGIASLLKCVLMFKEHIMPPQTGFPHALNPKFPPLDELNIQILSEPRQFNSSPQKIRRILMNNFDAAGGNACLLLEDPAVVLEVGKSKPQAGRDAVRLSAYVVAISARSSGSFSANKTMLLHWLQANKNVRIQDVAYTTTARRMHHHIRWACAASSMQELISKLESNVTSGSDDSCASSRNREKRPIVFVFTGQGSHYVGMGRELYATSAIFRETVDMCLRLCTEQGFDLLPDLITGDTTTTTNFPHFDTVQTQLAVVILEISLATFWRRAGVEPSMVMGHSLGEYAALYVSGVLTLSDTLYIVGQRARLLQETCEANVYTMLAVAANVETVNQHVGYFKTTSHFYSLGVACVNSPQETVISGTLEEVEQFQRAMQAAHIRSKKLAVPYGFHSLQVESILEDLTACAAGISFSPPQIPVASTLVGSVVDSKSHVFDVDYFAAQTRQPVDFMGAIGAAHAALTGPPGANSGDVNPFWLEIGPARVCGAFVLATLSSLACSGAVVSTLESGANAWESVSRCLASLYSSGIDIDWLGLYAPVEKSLRLLTLPSYAWDTKDYWLKYTERAVASDITATTPEQCSTSPLVSTCAGRVIHTETEPKFLFIFCSSLMEPDMRATLAGHVMREVPILPGSVLSEAALSAALWALEARSGQKYESLSLVVRNIAFKRPLTTSLVGEDGELHTTAIVHQQDGEHDRVEISFRGHNKANGTSYDLGGCEIVIADLVGLQRLWDSTSYYIKASASRVMRSVRDGRGHRIRPEIFYSLFSRTVNYRTPSYKCIKEAYVSLDFNEAVAEITLHPHPASAMFVASPYWGEGLAHLAGFLVNHHPNRSVGGTEMSTTLVFSSAESFERTTEFEVGVVYLTYTRLVRKEGSDVFCEIVVFDDKWKMVMKYDNVCFHEVQNSVFDALCSGKTGRSAQLHKRSEARPGPSRDTQPRMQSSEGRTGSSMRIESSPSWPESRDTSTTTPAEDSHMRDASFGCILESIAKETGASLADLTDEVALSDIGLDSIMAIEIMATVKSASGIDLAPSLILSSPTIGHLRRELGEGQPKNKQVMKAKTFWQEGKENGGSSTDPLAIPKDQPRDGLSTWESGLPISSSSIVVVSSGAESVIDSEVAPESDPDPAPPIDGSSPQPKARVTLLSGRPTGTEPRLYLMADGCGTVANYLSLVQGKFSFPIYGMDSPYLRCPARLTPSVGIEGLCRHLVTALLAHLSTLPAFSGPVILGGYSGGATLAYEVTRQLAVQGRRVDGLLLLDMRCPLPSPAALGQQPAAPPLLPKDLVWKLTQHAFALETDKWDPSRNTSQHLGRLFACVASYHPAALSPDMSPPTAIIWCAQGMLRRLEKYPDLMAAVLRHGMPTEAYPGYMEDSKMGHVVWGLLDKRAEDIAPNGWERYVSGGNKDAILCLSVPADHHEIIQEPHVGFTWEALERAMAFVLRGGKE